jgi:ATP-dependent DNA helicase DinG
VPASWYASQGKRIAIVTATIALTEQLIHKDLPAIADAVPWRFTYALLKGRANYLCNDRRLGESKGVSWEDREAFDRIQRWAANTHTGDKASLPFVPVDRLWNRFTVDSDDCKGKDCAHEAACFYGQALAEALAAGVIVTNYHLLFADAYLRSIGAPGILPRLDAIICDEAHEAADIAREFFGATITKAIVARAAKYAREDYEADGTSVRELQDAQELAEQHAKQITADGDAYFEQLRAYAAQRIAPMRNPRKPDPPSWRLPLDEPGHPTTGPFLEHVELLRDRAAVTLGWLDDLEKHRALGRDERERRARARSAVRKFTKAASWLREFDTVATPNIAAWIDATTLVDRITLEARPVLAAAFVCGALASTPARVLTSATLTVGGRFDFLERETGLTPTERLAVESPFDFASRCAVIVPEELPMPDERAWGDACVGAIAATVHACDGRTLALFSSRTQRDYCFERMPLTGRKWLRQGDLPPRQLTEAFRRDARSVLFGTKSFWTGIDVPGDSLVAVVIDRVPFPQRDDPVVRRIHQLDPENAFWDYDLPKALMQLRQGFGRLIRSRNDYGVIVILDRRLNAKSWRRAAWASLPATMRGRSIRDLNALLERVRTNATGVSE